MIAGHPTNIDEEFFPIDLLNHLLSIGHSFYFVNRGFSAEVSGFEDGFIIMDPNGIKNKNIRELRTCGPHKLYLLLKITLLSELHLIRTVKDQNKKGRK